MRPHDTTNNSPSYPRRVVFVHHGSMPGGAPTSLRNSLQELRRQAPEIEITTGCIFASMIPFFAEVEGIRVEKYPDAPIIIGRKFIGYSSLFGVRGWLRFFYELLTFIPCVLREKKWLQAKSPDLVHLNSSILISTAIAARLAGVPVVWHVRENIRGGRFNIAKRLYTYLMKRLAKSLVAISPSDAERLGPSSYNNIHIVYNALDFKTFDASRYTQKDARSKLRLPQDAFIAVSLGGLFPRKGAVQMLEAASHLNRDCHIVVAGGPSSLPGPSPYWYKLIWKFEDTLCVIGLLKTQMWRYQERVAAMLLNVTQFHHIGHCDNIPELLAACDVLIFGGTTPHFARPVYEAWAMLKPAVAFDSPVMQAELADRDDALIVDKRKPIELVQALHLLQSSPELCSRMAINGNRKARERFDILLNTKMLLDIYRTSLA